MDGILRCSRYAFGPNRLHYCGPDQNREIFSHITENIADLGLEKLLTQFETMYPYLKHIADANKIREPLNEKVVEAYWLGNPLLEKISKQKFYSYLTEELRIQDKLDHKSFELVKDKIGFGALPHHSFHVLDIWKRSGKVEREHSVNNMNECLVRVGEVVSVAGPFIYLNTASLEYTNGKLSLGVPQKTKLVRELESDYDVEQLKTGDLVTIHWSVICEKISKRQADNVMKYTNWHINLANKTI